MNYVAIIPARGGSKGIFRKNLRKVGGYRLVEWSIKSALACRSINKVVVTTDCPHIARSAEQLGAEAVMRPPEFAGDEASSESAILHCLEALSSTGYVAEIVVFLQCTSPFTTADEIEDLIAPLHEGAAKSTFLGEISHGFLWSESDNGSVVGINHDEKKARLRRQDRSTEFRETGAGYAFRADDFIKSENRFIPPIKCVQAEQENPDIDDKSDLSRSIEMVRRIANADSKLRLAGRRRPKFIVSDFDGVHTDAKVHVDENGLETVVCNRRDGMGVQLAKEAGIGFLILSKEKNVVVNSRAKKLGVECIHGCDQKDVVLDRWLSEQNLTWADIAYIGDDINDLDCLQLAEISAAPNDATAEVKKNADIVLEARGGEGCVRELIETLLIQTR